MKAIKLFLTLFLFGASNLIIAEDCECYCSVKCGPRKLGEEKSDSKNKTLYSKKFKKLFCQERDYRLFLKNKCNVKEEKEPTVLNNSCKAHKIVD